MPGADKQKLLQENFDRVFDSLLMTKPWPDAGEKLKRQCDWKPGSYTAELRLATDAGFVVRLYSFELTEKECPSLIANSIVMLRQSVGQQDWVLYFAYPGFQVADD